MMGRNTNEAALDSVADFDPVTLGKPKVPGSLLLHLGFLAVAVIATFAGRFIHHNEWGNQQPPGAIQATLVSSAIPLPQDTPPTPNVLATETPSPSPATPQPTIATIPPDDAVPIATIKPPPKKELPKKREEPPPPKPQPRREISRPAPKYAQPTQQQHHASYGEAAATQMPRSMAPMTNGPQNPVSMAGGSNGFNYPWYVSLIQSKVSQAWYRQEVDPHTRSGSQTKVTFSIARDGSVSNVRISQSSGSPTLDSSGLRAVQRVENFSPLPSGYNKSSVSVEYTFTYDLNKH
ncbi:MAG TPA: TonB family protein [Silvibacterium sp.]|nr:TonB family protein [Silvibacterium sp.]